VGFPRSFDKEEKEEIMYPKLYKFLEKYGYEEHEIRLGHRMVFGEKKDYWEDYLEVPVYILQKMQKDLEKQ